MAIDIGRYLTNIDDVELGKRLMSDYKDQKPYSYFASGWMKEIKYQGIDEHNKYCFLKSKCTPSQRVKDIPWEMWIVIEKKTGQILSAYCTCFAGYSTTCNHMAALLYKVDFAWRNGITNPACTSPECKWSAFVGNHSVEPKRVEELSWNKPRFSAHASLDTSEGINPKARGLFSLLGSRSSERTPSLASTVPLLYTQFKDSAAFAYVEVEGAPQQMQPCSDVNVQEHEEVVSLELPDPLIEFAVKYSTAQDILRNLPIYTKELTENIEKLTRGQAENCNWSKQRKGRVTGSVAHAVLTRVRTQNKSADKVDFSSIVNKIMGHTIVRNDLPALKYGQEMESEAREAYRKTQQAQHQSLNVQDCGLFVMHNQIYIGAGPDGLSVVKGYWK